MKNIVLIIIMLPVMVAAQSPMETINRAVDSLFIRASNINVIHADLAQPAKKALAEMGEKAFPRLVEKMMTQDAREMQTLEEVFKMIGHPAVACLVDALGSDNNYRRRLSARILGEMADTSAVNGLMQFTNDSDFRMRSGVIYTLGKIGDPRGVPPSMIALADGDYLVRTAAAISLSFLKSPTTIFPLIDALSDSYYGVRYPASAALGSMGKPAVEPVFNALKEPADTLAFYLLIEITGNLRDSKFVEPLSKIINSDDPYARAFAAEALGKIGGSDALKLLHKRYEIETHPLVISKIESIVLN